VLRNFAGVHDDTEHDNSVLRNFINTIIYVRQW